MFVAVPVRSKDRLASDWGLRGVLPPPDHAPVPACMTKPTVATTHTDVAACGEHDRCPLALIKLQANPKNALQVSEPYMGTSPY